MIAALIEQHASEAAFLWRLRDAAVTDPHYDLGDLAALDERVEAHLDGLRLAGDEAWEICAAAIAEDKVGEAFTAAVIAAGQGKLERIALLLDASLGADPVAAEIARTRRGIVSALGWLDLEIARPLLPGLLSRSCPPALQLLGIGACAAHRTDPGTHLDDALFSDNIHLRARALMAVGELGRADLHDEVRRDLGSGDADSRFAAAWTLALAGHRDGVDVLVRIAESGGRHALPAASLALRRIEPRAAATWVKRTAELPDAKRLAVTSAGATGNPDLVPFLLATMETPDLARIAGEAFTLITGADLERDGLRGRAPEGFEAGPNDDPADPRVAMDPDQNLPWPDLAKVRAWWNGHRGELAAGSRHLLGKPMDPRWLREVLRRGYQRQRHAAALELALVSQSGPFEVRAPAFRQLKQLH